MTIPEQFKRKAERALHKAALAIQRNDIEAKKKHTEEAELYIRLLRDAGCKEELEQINEDAGFYRCSETEDLFQ